MTTETQLKSCLLDYYNKCKSGQILIGKELMLCLENLRGEVQNPHYQYDLTDAHKRIKFIETKCCHRGTRGQVDYPITKKKGQKILLLLTSTTSICLNFFC